MYCQRKLQWLAGVVYEGEPDPFGAMAGKDLLVGLCQAQRQDAIDVLQEGGAGSHERQEISLREQPERGVLFGAYRCAWRLTSHEPHVAAGVTLAQAGNHE